MGKNELKKKVYRKSIQYKRMADAVNEREWSPVKWEDRVVKNLREKTDEWGDEYARLECMDRSKMRFFCHGHPLREFQRMCIRVDEQILILLSHNPNYSIPILFILYKIAKISAQLYANSGSGCLLCIFSSFYSLGHEHQVISRNTLNSACFSFYISRPHPWDVDIYYKQSMSTHFPVSSLPVSFSKVKNTRSTKEINVIQHVFHFIYLDLIPETWISTVHTPYFMHYN